MELPVRRPWNKLTSFYGSCANNDKGALNTPELGLGQTCAGVELHTTNPVRVRDVGITTILTSAMPTPGTLCWPLYIVRVGRTRFELELTSGHMSRRQTAHLACIWSRMSTLTSLSSDLKYG
eukprot:8153019-Pyramimonas_sp.AAC.2